MSTKQQQNEAQNLNDLRDALNALSANELTDSVDIDALQTFGGEPIAQNSNVYSWDADGVLVCDSANGGEFEIVTRIDLQAWLDAIPQ